MSRVLVQVCGAVLSCALIPAAFADDVKAGGGGDSLRDITFASIGFERVTTDLDNVGAMVNIDANTGIRIPTIDWIAAELDASVSIIPGKNSNQSSGILGKADCVGGVPNVPPGCTIPGGGGGGGGGGSSSNTPTTQDDLQMFSIGVFLALRSPGRFYASGKVGYRYLGTNIDTADNKLYDKRTGVAWSGGLGWRWGQTLSGVEVMYTDYGAQIRGVGLNIVYGFGGGHY